MKKQICTLLILALIGIHCGSDKGSDLSANFNEVPDTVPSEALFANWDIDTTSSEISESCGGSFSASADIGSINLKKLSQETATRKGNCTLSNEDLDSLSAQSEINCKAGGSVLVATVVIKDTYSGCTLEEETVFTFKINNNKATGTMQVNLNFSGNCDAETKSFENCSAKISFSANKTSGTGESDPVTPVTPVNDPSDDGGTDTNDTAPSNETAPDKEDKPSTNPPQKPKVPAKKAFNESCSTDADCETGLACTCQENAPCNYGLCRVPCAPNDGKQNNCEMSYHCVDDFCFTKDEIKKALDNAFSGMDFSKPAK